MTKQSQSARGRYVSAEKVQELFAQLGVELCAGRKRIRAARSDKSISIYVNGGTVNTTFNEKGGKDVLCLPSADLFPQEPGMEKGY